MRADTRRRTVARVSSDWGLPITMAMSSATSRICSSPKPAGGEGGSAKADARGVQRRVDVERDGILIHGDVGEVEGLFRFFAANAAGEDVNQNDVAVGATGDDAETVPLQGLGEGAGIGQHLPLVIGKSRLHGFEETDRFGGDDVH